MKEPKELSPEARELLQVEPLLSNPTAADQARILESLRHQLPPSPDPSQAPPPPAPSATTNTPWPIVGAAGIGLGLVVAYFSMAGQPSTEQPSTESTTLSADPHDEAHDEAHDESVIPDDPEPSTRPEAPPPDSTSSSKTDPANAIPPAPNSTDAPAKPPSRATPAQKQSPERQQASPGLAEEVALLSQATSALHAGQAQAALDLLAQHQQRFPRGHLTLERRAARAQSLCKLGRRGEAERELRRLPADSPLFERTRRACQID